MLVKIKSVEDYYETLKSYNKKVDLLKNEIKLSALSNKEKHQVWTSSKLPCINCNNPVNTFFSNKNRKLTVLCGAAVNPVPGYTACDLNITIDLPSTILLEEILTIINKNKELMNEMIIKTKLDYIFKFVEEDQTIDLFEKYKLNLEKMTTAYEKYIKIYSEKYDVNEEMYNIKIEEIIIEIKRLINLQQYREAIEVQINQLEPLIQDLKKKIYKIYEIREVESRTSGFGTGIKQYKLVTSKKSIASEEIDSSKINITID